jgi:hypothetical protein
LEASLGLPGRRKIPGIRIIRKPPPGGEGKRSSRDDRSQRPPEGERRDEAEQAGEASAAPEPELGGLRRIVVFSVISRQITVNRSRLTVNPALPR